MHALYIYVPREVKHALAKKTPQLLKNGKDVIIQKGSGTRCSRYSKLCQMHDTRL